MTNVINATAHYNAANSTISHGLSLLCSQSVSSLASAANVDPLRGPKMAKMYNKCCSFPNTVDIVE